MKKTVPNRLTRPAMGLYLELLRRIKAENKKINSKRETLKAQKTELETRIKASQEAAVSVPKLERMVELIRQQLKVLDFEGKRQVLDMLNITVWLDGENVEITGVIPTEDDVTVNMPSQGR